jgi:hypothetical protein
MHTPLTLHQRQKLQNCEACPLSVAGRGLGRGLITPSSGSLALIFEKIIHIYSEICLTTVNINVHLVNISSLTSSPYIEQAFYN